MSEASSRARLNFWIGVAAVASTYAYFLLFAEFAFLELVGEAVAGENGLRRIMGALGLGGVVGSVAAVRNLNASTFLPRLQSSFAACAVAAGLALLVSDARALTVVAAGVGLALGFNTVTLASGLRRLLGRRALGIGAGLGTGIAYALCNVPIVFTAAPRAQALISLLLALAAAASVSLVHGPLESKEDESLRSPPRRRGLIVVFLALVWLDSAAFYVIQHTSAYREATWAGGGHLWINAAAHIGAAVLAGWLLDRGFLRIMLFAAWVALAVACLALETRVQLSAISVVYACGVSFYSAALVFFAAGDGRPATAAATFAISGWVGSALGIGMVQDLHNIPWPIVALSGAVTVWVLRRRVGTALIALLAGVTLSSPLEAQDDGIAIARGRQVYIAEGCINCHSQYVRPHVAEDVERWGPVRALDDVFRERPPLLGNRRQGPDLSNVGNRRTVGWNRLHLMAPRDVSPGSRMPKYAHLFGEGDERGEALLAYLASLGRDTLPTRLAMNQDWRPQPGVAPILPDEAAKLFRENCAQCHGPGGRGDGVLAPRLLGTLPDWQRDLWRHVNADDEVSLERLIKFGVPATLMAGHESWTDAEIVGLARFVKALHN